MNRIDEIKQVGSVSDCAQALIDKLIEIEKSPGYKDVWTMYWIHDGIYNGPNYVQERDNLILALSKENANKDMNK